MYIYFKRKDKDFVVKKIFLRNSIAVLIGILIYLFTDVLLGIIVALVLEAFTFFEFGTILFDIMVRFIECIVQCQILLRLLNFVAIRNQQNINISELIVGTFIITTGLVALIIFGIKNSISLEDVTHLIFNTILGIVHISDAKEKWRFN